MSRRNWVILCLLLALSLILGSVEFTLGLLLGGLVITYSFHRLRCQLQALVQEPTRAMAHSVLMHYLLRLTALAALIAVFLASGRVDPIGLAAGLSVVVINLLWTTGKQLLHKE